MINRVSLLIVISSTRGIWIPREFSSDFIPILWSGFG